MKAVTNSSALAVLLCAVMALSACSEPLSSDTFVRNSQRDALGMYSFDLDMSDSTYVYDMDLYTRFDGSVRKIRNVGNIPLKIRVYDAEGNCYEEQSCLTASSSASSGAFSRYCRVPYRHGCVPKNFGLWKIQIETPGPESAGMTGLGLIVTKRRWEKTN